MALTLTMNVCKNNISRIVASSTNLKLNQSYKYLSPAREIHRKSIYESEKAKKFQFFVLDKYLNYLKNYDKILERNFPTTMKTYRAFMDGFKFFIRDTRQYFKIVLMLHKEPGNNFKKLLRREIELYHQMPKDMRKVFPIVLISPFPFAFYVILPVIYFFPKHSLCSQFWNAEQKQLFRTQYLQDRLSHSTPILKHLHGQLNYLNKRNHRLYEKWSNLLACIDKGLIPNPDDILGCRELFEEEPYHIMYLSHMHTRHLLKLHEIHLGWFRRTRLAERAAILIEMDKAIMREGGVHNLPLDALKHCCYIRGVNPNGMSHQEMICWLRNWIEVSSQIDSGNVSLLLHCPILLGYNLPSNLALMKSKK